VVMSETTKEDIRRLKEIIDPSQDHANIDDRVIFDNLVAELNRYKNDITILKIAQENLIKSSEWYDNGCSLINGIINPEQRNKGANHCSLHGGYGFTRDCIVCHTRTNDKG